MLLLMTSMAPRSPSPRWTPKSLPSAKSPRRSPYSLAIEVSPVAMTEPPASTKASTPATWASLPRADGAERPALVAVRHLRQRGADARFRHLDDEQQDGRLA